VRLEHLAQRLARPVAAGRAHQLAPRPDRHDVLRHVGRAAQGVLALAHPHHRHRRLGGDAVDVAAEVDVEHRVAHHGDPRALRAVQQLHEPRAREGVSHAGPT